MNNLFYVTLFIVIIFIILVVYYFKNKENDEDDMNVSTKNFMKSIKHYKVDQESSVDNYGILKKSSEDKQNKKIFINKPIGWVLAGSYEEETLKIQKKDFENKNQLNDLDIEKNHKRPNILCIDDSTTSLKMIEKILRNENFDYVLKDNGWDGLEYLKDTSHDKPDLIVSDIEMPKINGIELIQIIRKDRRYQNTPIILISSFPEAHIELIEKEIIQGFILKPFNENDLVEQIKYLLHLPK